MKSVWKEIRFDIRQGIIARVGWFVFVLLAATVLAAVFFHTRGQLISDGRLTGTISYMDAWLWMFRGMEVYHPESKEAFDLADSYLVWNFLLAFVIGDYPVRELRGTGKDRLVRSQSRVVWWIGKFVWSLAAVLVFFACIHAGTMLAALANGAELSLSVNAQSFVRIFKTVPAPASMHWIVQKALLLPVLSGMAIATLQMLVMLALGAVAGYASVAVIAGVSAFYMKWFLPGNGMMVWRYDTISSGGLRLVFPVLADICIIVVCAAAGQRLFRNHDVL